jgi:hypothetical protein
MFLNIYFSVQRTNLLEMLQKRSQCLEIDADYISRTFTSATQKSLSAREVT